MHCNIDHSFGVAVPKRNVLAVQKYAVVQTYGT